MSDVANIEDYTKYEPQLEAIREAFTAVFPGEIIKTVEVATDDRGQVFTITSDKLARTYLRTVGQSFEELLRTVPHLPPDKTA